MEQGQQRLWTKGFLVLTVCNLLLFINLQMLLPSFPTYVKEQFHASDFMVSLVTSLFALAAIVTRIFAGHALQRGKKNLIMYTGLLIAGVVTVLYPLCGSLWLLLLLRMGYGVGFGMSSTTFPTLVSNVIPQKRMGEGMGYFGLSSSLAMSVGPVIGLTILSRYGFGTLSVVATVILVVAFPLTLLFRSKKETTDQKAAAAPVKNQWFDRKILLPFTLNFLLSVTYGGLLSFLALFGKESHMAGVGNFFLFNALAIILVRPISGKIFDSRGHKAVVIPGAILVFLGLTCLSFSTTITMVLGSALLYGFGYGALQPSIQAWMIMAVTPEQRGMANGMFINSLDFGVAVGSMLLGVVATMASYSVMYRTSALAMVVLLVVYVLATMRKSHGSVPNVRM